MVKNNYPKLIGNSESFKNTIRQIKKFSICDASVLLQGETGTGKELSARAIHYLGQRCDYPFVAVNCGALPETLIESELFGNEKGAFTDAREARIGLIAEAEGGTLFLDEVDSLPQKAQVALLRFLQDQTYRPLGGRQEKTGNVRIIAAASSQLPELIDKKLFRLDLCYRLGVLDILLPPLRDRPGDPALLANHFINKFTEIYSMPKKQLTADCVRWLNSYQWPGNIRELENKIHRGLLLAEDDTISIMPPPPDNDRRKGIERRLFSITSVSYKDARQQVLERFEKQYLIEAMRKSKGNVTHASRIASKERRAFGKLLKKHDIDRNSFNTYDNNG